MEYKNKDDRLVFSAYGLDYQDYVPFYNVERPWGIGKPKPPKKASRKKPKGKIVPRIYETSKAIKPKKEDWGDNEDRVDRKRLMEEYARKPKWNPSSVRKA